MTGDGHDYGFAVSPSREQVAKLPLNDLGNGFRLMLLTGSVLKQDGTWDTALSTLLFLSGHGWIVFNGKNWDLEAGEDLARRAAHLVATTMAGASKELAEAHPAEKEIWKFIKGLGSAAATSAMLRQAQSYLIAALEDFDREPFWLNCQNGTVKIFRGEDGKIKRCLAPHRAGDRLTRIAAVAYDPAATCPEFEAAHKRSFQRSLEEREYSQRCLGYCASGSVKEQVFFVFQGRGRDGKTTILGAVSRAIGSYGLAIDVGTILDTGPPSSSGPAPDLVRLAGDRRLAVASEPKKGAVLDDGKVKVLTGGSSYFARQIHQKGTELRTSAKIVIECNHLPHTKSDDDGLWRRIRVVLFRHQLPIDQVDLDLPARIAKNELPGVLNWLLEGLEQYLKFGLHVPPPLQGFAGAYRAGGSPLLDWLQECCVWGDDAGTQWTTSNDLRQSLNDWWDQEGHDPNKRISMRTLGDFLTDRQIGRRRSRTGNVLRGPIRLKTLAERAATNDIPEGDDVRAFGRSGAGSSLGPALSQAFIYPDDEQGDEG